jgi:hypothetical protein
MTTKESVRLDLRKMKASCKAGVNIKGARKVIQDELKAQTRFYNWTVYFDGEKNGRYQFTLINPYFKFLMNFPF